MTASEMLAMEVMPGACLVEVTDGPEASQGGIFYADRYRPMPGWGFLRRLAPDCVGKGASEGDNVVFKRWAGKHFETDDGKTLVLCDFDKHIEAVIEGNCE
ncbi:MAG: hypothetical protein KA354_24920 [Phycisphaerae bacterium]|nr:hypothetical protein [Phycisphaerae bacterium]